MDKVSVVIPAYNRADFTVEAVQSVLNQSYPNIEIIVVDDGSTDDTYKKLSNYVGCEIEYLHHPNRGASYTRNRGIKYATGKYIAFLDCDDKYDQNKIAFSVNEMKRQEVDMIYNSAMLIDQEGIAIKIYEPKRHNLLFRNSIMNSVMIKKEVFDKVGLFDEELFICADWDMWLRIEEHYKIGYIDFPLTEYRV